MGWHLRKLACAFVGRNLTEVVLPVTGNFALPMRTGNNEHEFVLSSNLVINRILDNNGAFEFSKLSFRRITIAATCATIRYHIVSINAQTLN